MLTEVQIARLAAAVSHLRPEWPQASLHSFISRNLAGYTVRDAAVMLTWVAVDPDTETPARMLEAGPWRQTATLNAAPGTRSPHDRQRTCSVCALAEVDCRSKWSTDHPFVSVAEARAVALADRRRAVDAAAAARAALRPVPAELSPEPVGGGEPDAPACVPPAAGEPPSSPAVGGPAEPAEAGR
jgi:hypothetical protein